MSNSHIFAIILEMLRTGLSESHALEVIEISHVSNHMRGGGAVVTLHNELATVMVEILRPEFTDSQLFLTSAGLACQNSMPCWAHQPITCIHSHAPQGCRCYTTQKVNDRSGRNSMTWVLIFPDWRISRQIFASCSCQFILSALRVPPAKLG